MQLYHDIPKSKGVENALKRARQMLDILKGADDT